MARKGNKLQWFKVWSDIMNDPDVAQLSDGAFRAYMAVMCFVNEYGDHQTGDTLALPSRIEWQSHIPIAPYLDELLQSGRVTLSDQGTLIDATWTETNPRELPKS